MGEGRPVNPIIKMLAWRVKKLRVEDVQRVLAAIASLDDGPFTLTEVISLLPDEIRVDRNKRRRVGNLLQGLVSLGYLSKPSERKWVKNAPTLSHFLSQYLLELSSIEKIPPHPPGSGKVIPQRQKLGKFSSR
ncbi:MAG: hypothetical protein N3F65_03505 [Nitrososphaeria archaeon]|nr:hypothetical protein [Aigarchaeota archaeon]MCX8187657.1 hypothetical protein [Nitrososphaeria archaeon]MDW8021552.1 hypothetical protein [Nitrososphaerota archaeon]